MRKWIFGFTLLLTPPLSPSLIDIPRIEIETIRARPEAVECVYQYHAPRVRSLLGSEPSDNACYLTFCSMVAHRMAPYGKSRDVKFKELLGSIHLNCGNYGLLAYYLALAGRPQIFAMGVELHCVGWLRGPVGDHQILFVVEENSSVLLDPTTGLIALNTSPGDVQIGHPVPGEAILDSSYWKEKELFEKKMRFSLEHGRFAGFEPNYHFRSLEGFINYGTDGVHTINLWRARR